VMHVLVVMGGGHVRQSTRPRRSRPAAPPVPRALSDGLPEEVAAADRELITGARQPRVAVSMTNR
jgi:hypothetical protein